MQKDIEWSAPEFEAVERGAFWHLGSLVLAIGLGIFALWQANYLFFLFVVLAEAVVLIHSRHHPRQHEYILAHQGLVADGQLKYFYNTMRGFAVSDDGVSPYVELVLRSVRRLSQDSRFLLPRELSLPVRQFLSERLEEFVYTESLAEVMMKRFGL